MAEKSAYFFKCFSHETRNQLLRLLTENDEMTVDALAEASNITASTASRHLNMLKMQGVVGVRIDPPAHYYHLDREGIIEGFREFLRFLDLNDKT